VDDAVSASSRARVDAEDSHGERLGAASDVPPAVDRQDEQSVKRTLLALPLALTLSACGGSSGRDVLRDASANLSKIRSGVLHARLLVQPRGGRQAYGFTIDGPFRFGEQPTANVTYVRIANNRREAQKLVIWPSGGYVVTNGERRALNSSDLDGVRQTMRAVRVGGSIVDVSSWVKSSESTDCPKADAPVACVKGELDPLEAVSGLLAIAQAVGTPSGNPTIQNADPEQLRGAVRKATYFVMAGKDDKLLRDLQIDLDLAPDVAEELRGFLGRLADANVRFEVAVDRPRA
jgi:hypothetical protein